jgi:aminoglycoside 6-adenylyltransferase
MRSEEEMMDLILGIARADERIRAVILNGSRVNPKAKKDIFQDYDVIYVVTEMAPFKRNLEWIQQFGEMMILQLPDDMSDPPPGDGSSYAYLMQFADGNRIDLTLLPIANLNLFLNDSLSVTLLDKDGTVPPFLPPSEYGYLPIPPSQKAFDDCCNEFWWVSPYVAKGLWRRELIYARQMMEIVREQLMKMLHWYIGVQTAFKVNPGKFGKHYEKNLAPELWAALLRTYAPGDYEATWEALLAMGDLFRTVAVEVGQHFGYAYPEGDEARVNAHLRHVRALPKDAEAMYYPKRD